MITPLSWSQCTEVCNQKQQRQKVGSLAKDKFQLKEHPWHPPARYSQEISIPGAESRVDWKLFYAKELHDHSSILELVYQSLLGKMDISYESLSEDASEEKHRSRGTYV